MDIDLISYEETSNMLLEIFSNQKN
jgi:hypothetical protein